MRRTLALAASALLALGGSAAAVPTIPVSPMVPDVPGTAVLSPNVTHLGTIPLEGVGVSMRTRTVGGQVRAFVSGVGGLSIYDATNPRSPLLLGHLPMYNWENEDIAVSGDGKTAILTEFMSTLYLHVVDVSDPTLPMLKGSMVLHGAHTVECADRACDYAFGSDGQTYDLRDKANPVELPASQWWGVLTKAGGGHNVHRDAGGYWISDTSPLVMFKLNPDPLHLKVMTTGPITLKTAYQHNNVRPRGARYVPRKRGESLSGPLRDGELLLGEGETNFKTSCSSGSGAFSTWSLAGFDRGAKMRQLHVLRPVTGALGSQDPAINAMGCSGHWFSVKDSADGQLIVAAAWYEHGTRFLKVNPRTGTIKQIGYYQPQRGATSAAYWMGNNTVWSVDYHSGIDILAFDQDPSKVPTPKAIEASWLAKAHVVDPLADAMRKLCRAGGEATPADHARLHALVS